MDVLHIKQLDELFQILNLIEKDLNLKGLEPHWNNTTTGIEHLNSGYLTHRILDLKILAQYLEAIEDNLEETAPALEPVFTNVYQY